VRSRLSHAALAARAARTARAIHAPARSSPPPVAATPPPVMHVHSVPPATAPQARHRLPHHLRLGRPLAASHPARLARFQHYLFLGLDLTSHTDEALSDAHLRVTGLINRNTKDGPPYGDDRRRCGQRLGVGSTTQLLDLHAHAPEKDMEEFVPTASRPAKNDMGIGVDADSAAIGHPDGGRRFVIGEDFVAGFDGVMGSEKHRRSWPTHEANFPLHCGHLSFHAALRPDRQGDKQQNNQSREIEVGPSHLSLASRKSNPMTAPAQWKSLILRTLFFVLLLSPVRFGHSGVSFAHETPAFEFLVKSAALNTQAFGCQCAIASGQS